MYCMAAARMPVHCCSFLRLCSADTRITNRDDQFDVFTYITFPLYFAFIILPILFGTLHCPCPPHPTHHSPPPPPAAIKSHSYKSSGILNVLEPNQAN